MPPTKKARVLAPFLTNTPAQIPATVPNDNSYKFNMDSGGGGRGFSDSASFFSGTAVASASAGVGETGREAGGVAAMRH